MNAATLTLTAVPWTHPHAGRLRDQMDAEVGPRYADLVADRGPRVPVDPASVLVTYVAYDGDRPVGTASLRLAHGEHEVKRVFVAGTHRRLGLAARLLDAVGGWAADAGVRTIVLQTGVRQPEAVALYRREGWHAIEPFGDYVGDRVSLCFAKDLA
ncbi:GNAT family N-acetyltransferase [Cellulomonas humilata]|uniref:GNAT family N-acetyltransferase n=1 Tax=Cellulomonas humilata TaxID=144055 RepID=A0A7Y6DWW2_9CELL|nr:GNAT family N-acetyltransferase [Cellulomonas humilata]NUU16402.1 GNAT family N-acetyltransferase [Cellulomonas humilata]